MRIGERWRIKSGVRIYMDLRENSFPQEIPQGIVVVITELVECKKGGFNTPAVIEDAVKFRLEGGGPIHCYTSEHFFLCFEKIYE